MVTKHLALTYLFSRLLIPGRETDTAQDFRTKWGGGRNHWFESPDCRISYLELILVIETGRIHLQTLMIVSAMVVWKSSQCLAENVFNITFSLS